MFKKRSALYGLALWAAGTAAIRVAGERLLRPHQIGSTLMLYAVSLVVMALLVRRIFSKMGVSKENWATATCLLMLPTLLLDPLSCVFFADVFPNVDPGAAGEFGGWMLTCCGGAVGGALTKR